MPYALFANTTKVSEGFSSKADVWRHAEQSGLVAEFGLGEEDPPRRILDMDYAISECSPEAVERGARPGMSEHEIAQMIAACRVNPPSATAAS